MEQLLLVFETWCGEAARDQEGLITSRSQDTVQETGAGLQGPLLREHLSMLEVGSKQ